VTPRKPTEPVTPAAKPPVRDGGPGEGARGNREVPPASDAATEEPRTTELLDSSEREARLAEAETQRDEYLRDLQRLAADFDNYRKRAAREQEALVARAHERLVRELLPVLDDLERALVAAEEHDEAKLVDGVKLVRQALQGALEREGLAEIEAEGTFDPHVHEALLAQPAEGREHGDVLEVIQKGYRLGDRVLRPARVVVAE
jgi:molecular chaperone GrpE